MVIIHRGLFGSHPATHALALTGVVEAAIVVAIHLVSVESQPAPAFNTPLDLGDLLW